MECLCVCFYLHFFPLQFYYERFPGRVLKCGHITTLVNHNSNKNTKTRSLKVAYRTQNCITVTDQDNTTHIFFIPNLINRGLLLVHIGMGEIDGSSTMTLFFAICRWIELYIRQCLNQQSSNFKFQMNLFTEKFTLKSCLVFACKIG